MNNSNTYLPSKPRYEILDGLRGVAAMLVVAYHLFETYYYGAPNQPINHGYLAVDFFFVLSGFVIGYAYDDRWDRMSTWAFFKRRLIRLHPMVIFGTLFGALLFYFGSCGEFPLINQTPWWMVLLVMFWCFTMIPLPNTMDIRGWAETNPLNGPAWSLQWEYIANILYALVFRRLSKVALGICVAIFAVLTVILCLNIDVTGFLEARNWASYTVVGGWSTTPDQLQVGLTRLLYPFFCGLLISRVGKLIKVKAGFWWCSLMIIVLFCMPWMGLGTEGDSRWTNGLYEKGVKKIETNISEQLVTITYDADKTTPVAIIQSFNKFGYKASEVNHDKKEEGNEDGHSCCKEGQEQCPPSEGK